jgi:hypothetical protein
LEEIKLTLDDLVVTTEPGNDPTPSPYGYVIDADGRIHSMMNRYTHGVIIAVLYPDVAAKHGIPAPTGRPKDLDLRAYQNFEHEVSNELPILRIAGSMLGDFIMVSDSRHAATNVQIDSVRRALKASDRDLRDTLTGEEGDQTVGEFLDYLRSKQERERKEADGVA